MTNAATFAARYADVGARLTGFSGNVVRFEGARALAPGAPVTLEVERGDGTTFRLEGRSLGSRRPSDDALRFEIRARLVSLTRGDRDWLRAAFPG